MSYGITMFLLVTCCAALILGAVLNSMEVVQVGGVLGVLFVCSYAYYSSHE